MTTNLPPREKIKIPHKGGFIICINPIYAFAGGVRQV